MLAAHLWLVDAEGRDIPDPATDERFAFLAHHPGFEAFVQRACTGARSAPDEAGTLLTAARSLRDDPFREDPGLTAAARKWGITQWSLANWISEVVDGSDEQPAISIPQWTQQVLVTYQGDSWVLRIPAPPTAQVKRVVQKWLAEERYWPTASELQQTGLAASDTFHRPKEHASPRTASLLGAYSMWRAGELTGREVYDTCDLGSAPPTLDGFFDSMGKIHDSLAALSADGLPAMRPTASSRADLPRSVRG